MNTPNELLTAALLGTERGRWTETTLPEELAPVLAVEVDREDRFLQLASALAHYRHCGALPLRKTDLALSIAPEEDRAYCPPEAAVLLREILETESASLLRLWLEWCVGKERIVPPEWLPALMEQQRKLRHLQPLIGAALGKRGAWLADLNPDWREEAPPDDVWETGNPQQRLRYLEDRRRSDPAAARALLQQVWATENAATRTELLSALEVQLGPDDEPWLTELLKDKSTKVRSEALRLLKQLPEGGIVRRYREALAGAVHLQKEKGLLGIGTKNTLDLKFPEPGEDLYATGLEKRSSQSGVSDEAFLLYQLAASVPPSFWEAHLAIDPPQILDLFRKHALLSRVIPAFATAAATFRDPHWAKALAGHEDGFSPELPALLSDPDWEAYALKHLPEQGEAIVSAALHRTAPWSPALAKALLQYCAKYEYRYGRSFYNELVHILPIEVVPLLEKCTPPDPYLREAWSRTSDHILHLLTLKTRSLQAFAALPQTGSGGNAGHDKQP